MKPFLLTLAVTFIAGSASATERLDCNVPVAKIFAEIISVQNNVEVKASDLNIGHLTKYEWTIYTTLPNGKYVEYLADIDNDKNCNILSMIEANGEQPAYDRHWEKRD